MTTTKKKTISPPRHLREPEKSPFVEIVRQLQHLNIELRPSDALLIETLAIEISQVHRALAGQRRCSADARPLYAEIAAHAAEKAMVTARLLMLPANLTAAMLQVQ